MVKSETRFIQSSIDEHPSSFIRNITVENEDRFGRTLKIDETGITGRVRFNPADGKLVGLCYECSRTEDLEFTNYDKIDTLAQKYRLGEVHIPNDCKVFLFTTHSENPHAQVVAAFPSCSRKEKDYQCKIIETFSDDYKKKYGCPLNGWSSDGEASRHQYLII